MLSLCVICLQLFPVSYVCALLIDLFLLYNHVVDVANINAMHKGKLSE